MGNMWIFSVFPKYTSPAGINPKKYLEVTFIHRNKNILYLEFYWMNALFLVAYSVLIMDRTSTLMSHRSQVDP